MSQRLTPVPDFAGAMGLTPTIVTTTTQPRLKAYSDEYRVTQDLFRKPTQWVPGGRPIYRRLPAASETYQVDFFTDGGLGYVYIPPGQSQFGAGSMYVSQSENLESLLIYDGAIVWEVGTTPVFKTIVDFREIGLESGRFLVCYQLLYDAEPEPLPFQVTDFSLGGQDFDVNDSASAAILLVETPNGNAWPSPGINAFAPASQNLSWKNFLEPVNRVPQANAGVQPGIPTAYQPLLCWLEWSSPLPWKLDTITLRVLTEGTLPPASLYYKVQDSEWELVQTAAVSTDSSGRFYQFITNTDPQLEWRVEWPAETKIEINDITVSGILTLYSKPSTPRARAQLAIYPTNLVPKDQILCSLAIINVNNFELQKNSRGEIQKEDIRNIATRDYEPVADWLTQYWDEQLTRNFEKVITYTPGFMAPPTLLKPSYYDLESYGIEVNFDDPVYPPVPEPIRITSLVGASVILDPPLVDSLSASVLIGAPSPGPSQITDIIGEVIP